MRTTGERLPPRLTGLVSYAEVAGLYATEWQRRGIPRNYFFTCGNKHRMNSNSKAKTTKAVS